MESLLESIVVDDYKDILPSECNMYLGFLNQRKEYYFYVRQFFDILHSGFPLKKLERDNLNGHAVEFNWLL